MARILYNVTIGMKVKLLTFSLQRATEYYFAELKKLLEKGGSASTIGSCWIEGLMFHDERDAAKWEGLENAGAAVPVTCLRMTRSIGSDTLEDIKTHALKEGWIDSAGWIAPTMLAPIAPQVLPATQPSA